MVAKKPKKTARVQIGVHLSTEEAGRLDIVLRAVEEKAGLRAGTLSPATYTRSILLQHIDRQPAVAMAMAAVAEAIGDDDKKPVIKGSVSTGSGDKNAKKGRR
jgi:hypothetical protein